MFWSEEQLQCVPTNDGSYTVDNLLKSQAVFFEDILIISISVKEYSENNTESSESSSGAALALKFKTCFLFQDQSDYLGLLIPPGRLAILVESTDALQHPSMLQTWLNSIPFSSFAINFESFTALWMHRHPAELQAGKRPAIALWVTT